MNTFKEENKKLIGENQVTPYPNILIVGPSGSGKTRSAKNLPVESTVFCNIENKTLTFPDADKWTDSEIHINRDNSAALIKAWGEIIDKALKAPQIKYVVVDSLLKYCEYLMDYARIAYTGYDVFNNYNKAIFNFLEKLKNNNKKFVITFDIDEIIAEPQLDGSSVKKRFAAVRGKEWEGKIEKEFPIVLFTEINPTKDKTTYNFVTISDGKTTTKTPEGMFKSKLIDNDLKLVCDTAEAYFKLQ